MFEDVGYAHVLRLIGQVLETLRIEAFAVTVDGESFVIRDKTRNRTQLTPRERAFLANLEASHGGAREQKEWHRLASGVLEWRLTKEDLERLERDQREKRRAAGQMADSQSLSQILRAIGGTLDQKAGRLIALERDAQTVSVECTTQSGQKTVDEYTIPMLYDLWVRMYKRRAAKDDPDP
jgi:hypothetical protein